MALAVFETLSEKSAVFFMKAAYDSPSQPPMLLVAPVTSVAIVSSLWLSATYFGP